MSNDETTSYYAYQGPLGQVVCDEVSFSASKDGFPVGTYNTYEGALESLCMEGKSQAIMNVTQVKDEIRYLSLSDKIEIYRWLDGELAGYLSSRIGSRRSMAIRRQIERIWNVNGNGDTPNSFVSELRTGLRTSTSSRSKTVLVRAIKLIDLESVSS
jgi:hypothetical protein